ncbi:MAG: YiiX/YebB-like N1pC/P60 family cysteine hydrolase [Flavobacteriales bacterium]
MSPSADGARQCRAIQLATHSEWTHCGVVFIRNGQWVVAEAVEPVVFTPVDEFIARGKKGIVGSGA